MKYLIGNSAKKSKTPKSLTFGAFTFLLFVLMIAPFFFYQAELKNNFSTHPTEGPKFFSELNTIWVFSQKANSGNIKSLFEPYLDLIINQNNSYLLKEKIKKVIKNFDYYNNIAIKLKKSGKFRSDFAKSIRMDSL